MLPRKMTAFPATLAAVLLLTPAVAASEGATQQMAAAEAQSDDHSYLPPWMRLSPGEVTAAPTTPDAQYGNAGGDPAKQKAVLAGKPAQKHHGYSVFGVSLDSINPFGR